MRLHNLAVDRRVPLLEDVVEEDEDDDDDDDDDIMDAPSAVAMRDRLVRRF